jgi:hypothetical protein
VQETAHLQKTIAQHRVRNARCCQSNTQVTLPLRCRAGISALDKPSERRRVALGAAPPPLAVASLPAVLSTVALAKADGEGGLSPHTTAEPASSGAECPVLLDLSRRREFPDFQTHYRLPRSSFVAPIAKNEPRAGLQTMSRAVSFQHGSFS